MKTFYINKSFKSHVNEYTTEDGTKYSDLISYETRVAYYNHNENFISVHGYFSATTAKHINEFLEYYGFEKLTKKQMEQKPQIQGT
jgi:hypothetical protein